MRKFLPTISELIDRLTINQLKEVFIPDKKREYSQEIKDIMHDINEILSDYDSNIEISAELIRNIIILAQYNLHIWHNESEARKGNDAGNNLLLTHSLNGVRNRAKNSLESSLFNRFKGKRFDHKVDCLSEKHTQWEPSNWGLNDQEKIDEEITEMGYKFEGEPSLVDLQDISEPTIKNDIKAREIHETLKEESSYETAYVVTVRKNNLNKRNL